jgi:imidazole glycerol-phosphate synthase subunit HisH
MITIIDFGVGNLGSILNMCKRVDHHALVTSDIGEIKKASRLILPGVGSYDNGMKKLKEYDLIPVLNELVLGKKIPLLGICLGMQLLAKRSEEGELSGLGWIDAYFKKFSFSSESSHLKIPHTGWNIVESTKPNSLIPVNQNEQRFYFVHSYHAVCNHADDIMATTHHGYEFTAAFSHENIYGVQFHPEKSHRFGMALMKKFLDL